MAISTNALSGPITHALPNTADNSQVNAKQTANFQRVLGKLSQNASVPTSLSGMATNLLAQLEGTGGGGGGGGGGGTPTQPTDVYGPLQLVTVGASSPSPDGTAWLAGPQAQVIVPVTDSNGDPVILDDGRPLYQALGGNVVAQ